MIKINNKEECCGCQACVQICPKRCIDFVEDGEGFFYPITRKEQCIGCNLCEKVCPVINTSKTSELLCSYAAINNNYDERIQSSSGGIFVLLAKIIIGQGGVVFGAKFDKQWNVVHAYTEIEAGLSSFMGSKYVQSRIGKTYTQAKRFLDSGKQVLFSGTPCQIAGLKKYLRRNYDNLLTVDVICHGVPSPMIWQYYLRDIKENVRKGESSISLCPNHSISERESFPMRDDVEIESIAFRDKRLGWKGYSFALTLAETTADGKKKTHSFSHPYSNNTYMKGFLANLILRPSCYKCPVKKGKSGADITLADFWGSSTVLPDLDDDMGISLVLIHTEKARALFNDINVKKRLVDFKQALKYNPSFSNSVPYNPKREVFFMKCKQNESSIDYLINIYTSPSKFLLLKGKIKNLLKTILKRSK